MRPSLDQQLPLSAPSILGLPTDWERLLTKPLGAACVTQDTGLGRAGWLCSLPDPCPQLLEKREG